MSTTSKRPKISIAFASDNSIELFNELQIDETIKNTACIPYLEHLFKTLSSKSTGPGSGISKMIFLKYADLPGIIGERLFAISDKNKDGALNFLEFMTPIMKINSSDTAIKMKLVFELYDFDEKNLLNTEDIKTLLIPTLHSQQFSQNNHNNIFTKPESYENSSKCLSEIDTLIQTAFGNNKQISFQDFKKSCEEITSEMFLSPYIILKNSLPGYEQFSNFNPSIKGEMSPKIKLASPKVFSTYTPINQKSKAITSFTQASINFGPLSILKQAPSPISPPKEKQVPKIDTKKEEAKKVASKLNLKVDDITNAINGIDLKKLTHPKTIRSMKLVKPGGDVNPLTTANDPAPESNNNIFICLCGKLISNKDAQLCPQCLCNSLKSEINGDLYGLDPKTSDFTKLWAVLHDKEIFLYESQSENSKPIKIISLIDSYISKSCYLALSFKGKQYYGFQLQSTTSSINFYADSQVEKDKWVSAMISTLDIANINEFYDMKGVLGRGRFGVVREAIHKITNTHVAIKGLIKAKMKSEDLEMIRREIEILKICNHPNVVKLFDYFENDQYVFMIIDFVNGSDLVNYFTHHNFTLSETQVAKIIIQLLKALDYIHSMGIVHRDIKGENILMTDYSENPIVKLTDFGLSKVIGSNEKCSESYGTLGYAAPELFLQKPYDKSVDIWGVGVVAFSLLSKGQMPFDASNDKDIIWYYFKYRKTVCEDVSFAGNEWEGISVNAKNFIKSTRLNRAAE